MSEDPAEYVVETNVEYKASDGSSFDDKLDAENYEKMLRLTKEFEEAQDNLCSFIAQHHLTGDGEPFNPTGNTYYYIADPMYDRPHILEIYISRWNYSFDDEPKVGEIMVNNETRLPINRLFLKRHNCYEAWVECYNDWIKGVQDERDHIIKQVKRNYLLL